MARVSLQKRPKDLFISYGHADRERVDPIVAWLKHGAGLKVWYDAASGDASKRTTTLLSNAITASRGALFFLSSSWMASTWCQDEHEVALSERRANNDFLVIAVRLDDCKLPHWFQIANVLDFRDLRSREAADLLRSLSPNPVMRFDADQDIYLAAPWSQPTNATSEALKAIAAMQWRLVGDAPNNPHFSDSVARMTSIIESSRGVICILPFVASNPPSFTNQWIEQEAQIARRCRQPYLLLAEAEVQLPEDLLRDAYGASVTRIANESGAATLASVLTAFDEALAHQPFSDDRTFSFLATSLLGEQRETDDLQSVIEHASNMTCILGQGFSGQHVQRAIIDRIRSAAFVIADVTDNNRNVFVEAGVAMGAGTPLHLMCRIPVDGARKKRFMFEDLEMNWYRDAVERLATVYRIATPYRRRVYFVR